MPILERQGARIFYETEGQGPPILLGHSLLSDSRMWESVAPELAKSHRVININVRGHGGSTAPSPFTLEDLEGSIEVLVFSPHYHSAAALLAEDSIVLVKGRLQRRDAVPLVRAVEIASPVLSHERTGPVVITVSALRCTPALVESLKDVLGTHPGGSEVHLRLRAQSSTKVLRLDERLRVTPSPALMAELKTLLGPSCLAT